MKPNRLLAGVFLLASLAATQVQGRDPQASKTPLLDELPDFEAHQFVPADENQAYGDNPILSVVAEKLKGSLRLGWILPPDRLAQGLNSWC